MAKQIVRDAKVFLGGFDISGSLNAVALEYGADLKDATTLGQDSRQRLGGLKTVAANVAGLWEGGTDAIDEILFGNVAVQDQPFSVSPTGAVEGDVGYTFKSVQSKYAPAGQHGEILKFSAEAEAAGAPLVRGKVLHNAQRAATGTGTVVTLGAIAAGQSLYAALHVLSVTGSVTAKVQSAPTAGFAAPVDRIAFNAAAAKGAQWGSVAGAVTDAYWRVSYTIVTGPVLFVVVAGIV